MEKIISSRFNSSEDFRNFSLLGFPFESFYFFNFNDSLFFRGEKVYETEDFQQGIIFLNKPEGYWIEADARGKYHQGLPEGEWTFYYENGNVLEKGIFKDGRVEGLWLSFYEDGKKEGEQHWKNGLREGHSISWGEDGQVAREGNYHLDLKVGSWFERNDNGYSKGMYDLGKVSGLWKFYNNQGRLVREQNYHLGVLFSSKRIPET